MSELDQFLNVAEEAATDAPIEPAAAEVTPTESEAEVKQEQAAEGSTSEPVKTEKESGHVPLAALLDEREKRQKLQAELEQYRSQQKPQETQPPDLFDDPAAYAAHVEQLISNKGFENAVVVSQAMMRMQHEDYDAMEAKFADMVKENPSLAVQLRNAELPAVFAYETAKKAEKLALLENVDEWEVKKTAELEAKIRAELTAELEAKASAAAKGDNLSPSLTKQRADGANSGVILDVPDPLQSTFNR